MWVRCGCPGAREEAVGSLGTQDSGSRGRVVSPTVRGPSLQLSSTNPIRSNGAHTSLHILPLSPALQLRCAITGLTSCFHSTICLSTSRNSFSQKQATLHHSGILLKCSGVQQKKNKKKREGSQKIKIPKLRANP